MLYCQNEDKQHAEQSAVIDYAVDRLPGVGDEPVIGHILDLNALDAEGMAEEGVQEQLHGVGYYKHINEGGLMLLIAPAAAYPLAVLVCEPDEREHNAVKADKEKIAPDERERSFLRAHNEYITDNGRYKGDLEPSHDLSQRLARGERLVSADREHNCQECEDYREFQSYLHVISPLFCKSCILARV